MKKLLSTLAIAIISSFSMQAEPLFPFFVDIVGVYDDGAKDIAAENGMTTSLVGRTDGGGPTAVRVFLEDVLPDGIRIEKSKINGYEATNISSTFYDGDQASVILLLEKDGKLQVMYFEGPAQGFSGVLRLPKER